MPDDVRVVTPNGGRSYKWEGIEWLMQNLDPSRFPQTFAAFDRGLRGEIVDLTEGEQDAFCTWLTSFLGAFSPTEKTSSNVEAVIFLREDLCG